MRYVLALAALAMLAACAAPEPKLTLARADYASLPGWPEDDHAEALRAFRRSCDHFMPKPDEAPMGKGLLASRLGEWKPACAAAMQTDDTSARQFFEAQFVPFRAGNRGREQGLFTGYYEPLLAGSLQPDERYRVPVYGVPPELSSDPYFTRAEIDAGALAGRNLELAWVDDPVALFFTHIQGSGRIALEDGSVVRIGYAGKNNRAYVALGKVLKDEGELPPDDFNLFTIRNWLITHPERAAQMMQRNPSYVFFRILQGEGPVGAQGAVLTPGRSLAVDPRFIPYGIPVFLMTSLPQTAYAPAGDFHRLMIAQDTGGAIRGPVRGDIFFGADAQAEALAGIMKNQGAYALLVPNPVAERLP
ncbi:MAG: murein transglycosylase A [Alphaproteobacteria bacterium]|nr:murein transglycosylase A [Alphaproteobacteria bacterium]